jgi:osmotically-inducible protein OsmY
MSMNDTDLVTDVSNELFWDPKIDNSSINVSADDGRITLTGTTASMREKREAKKAAERVFGVISVDNDLVVQPDGDPRTDAELQDDISQALLLDLSVPTTVGASVQDGIATLNGTADWQYQRDEAELVASNIVGMLDVFDEIDLVGPRPDAYDVAGSIKGAFKRNAGLDADALSVTTSNGSVTVAGEVSSWAEHDEAIDAAWAAPGVTSVDDEIVVGY